MASQIDSGGGGSIDIRAIAPDELRAAAAVLADGMRDNPLHVRVFGADRKRRQRRLSRFFEALIVYVYSNGEIWGAYDADGLIGVLGMIRPGRCRPSLMERARLVIMIGAPPLLLWRIHRWLAVWRRNDPDDPHWHIGPLAVSPDYRRRGVGRRLMTRCVERMDALSTTAWLETDLEINAAFYRTLGFVAVKKEVVLGAPVWFMSRSPGDARPGPVSP